MKPDRVYRTKSGIFVRRDPGIGILSYSPFSGSCFISPENQASSLLKWLDKKSTCAPSEQHIKALGPGWLTRKDEAVYPDRHLLPGTEDWNFVCVTQPISINWMLTGMCILNCRYCYAKDLMRGKVKEPDLALTNTIVDCVLSFNPLVVVLTGGEPLLSPQLEPVLDRLGGKTGIILDTSGIGLKQAHIEVLRKHNAFVRVSLDSERPKTNDEFRSFHPESRAYEVQSSSSWALSALCTLLDAGINVGVQSVTTPKNKTDFEALGDKLFKLGVSAWRILVMTPTSHNLDFYKEMVDDKRGLNRFYKQIVRRIKAKHQNDWNSRMTVQIVTNRFPNSVVLVGPDGVFYTESNIPLAGKVVIDERNPRKPSLKSISQKIDLFAHTDRYLNISDRENPS